MGTQTNIHSQTQTDTDIQTNIHSTTDGRTDWWRQLDGQGACCVYMSSESIRMALSARTIDAIFLRRLSIHRSAVAFSPTSFFQRWTDCATIKRRRMREIATQTDNQTYRHKETDKARQADSILSNRQMREVGRRWIRDAGLENCWRNELISFDGD